VSKSTITRVFVGSLISLAAGAVVLLGAVGVAFANNVFVMNGDQIAAVEGGPAAWSLIGLGLVGVIAIIGGLIGGLVSWIGALLNTWRVESKAWFVGLLLLGIFNFGCFAMIAYVIAGPDGRPNTASRVAQAPLRA
jgi:hypothetical protein